MKQPAPPPPLDDLLGKLIASKDTHKLIRVFGSAVAATDTDYLPWDKIRYKTPPEDLTLEEWWLGIRLTRDKNQRALPLVDADGKAFSYAIPDGVLKLVDEISRRASGQISVSEQVTNPATRDRYVINSLIEEAITSSQLEGASTSRKVAKDMIRTGRPPMDRSERMILNNYHAMRRVSEIFNEPFTPEKICELHRIVTEGTLDDPTAAGQLQSNPDPADRVAVWDEQDRLLHRPPPVDQLPERLQRLCDFANTGDESTPWIPPVLRALAVHFMMGYDHYFEDGNGRTARVLFYWSMLRQGYWLTEYLTISKILKQAPAQYVRSYLLTEQDNNDLTYFFDYHLRVIQRALNELDVYLARAMQELRDTRVRLAASPGDFNYRQLAVLELAIKDPAAAFTAQSHAEAHLVTNETARQDLSDLEKRGYLERSTVKRRFVWRPAKKLPEMLRDLGSA